MMCDTALVLIYQIVLASKIIFRRHLMSNICARCGWTVPFFLSVYSVWWCCIIDHQAWSRTHVFFTGVFSISQLSIIGIWFIGLEFKLSTLMYWCFIHVLVGVALVWTVLISCNTTLLVLLHVISGLQINPWQLSCAKRGTWLINSVLALTSEIHWFLLSVATLVLWFLQWTFLYLLLGIVKFLQILVQRYLVP